MLTKTCQWTVAHANQTQLSQIPSRVHILHISTGWLHWEIRFRLGHSGLGVIRVHSFLLGQIKPSIDEADTFNSSHSTSSQNIYPGAIQLLFQGRDRGSSSPGVFLFQSRETAPTWEKSLQGQQGKDVARVRLGEGWAGGTGRKADTVNDW